MTALVQFDTAFARCPLIAILRDVRPNEVEAIGETLVDSGFTMIEVPLNSPDPLDSIARLAQRLGDRAVIGAGTVLQAEDVAAVANAGGTLIVAPNTSIPVIAAAVDHALVPVPGFMTPSEAIAALGAGASALKLFPAEAASPAVLSATSAVLPTGTRVLPVGGIIPSALAEWRAAGAAGFGLGSALYRPGMTANEVSARAQAFIDAWNAAKQQDSAMR
jgi:2-dehydro-3-deoxyphosphogalactonate aldolase